MPYELNQFIDDTRAALKRDSGPAGRETVRKNLERLLENKDFVASTCGEDAPLGLKVLYEDKELVTRHLVDIRRFVALATDHGARVFVVPMDVNEAAYGGLRPGHKTFLTLAEQAGLPLISALELFHGMEHKELTVNWFDNHPNERAFRIAAARFWATPLIRRASGQLENTARVRTVRRDIARIKTILALKARG
jgi:hypothetical protein